MSRAKKVLKCIWPAKKFAWARVLDLTWDRIYLNLNRCSNATSKLIHGRRNSRPFTTFKPYLRLPAAIMYKQQNEVDILIFTLMRLGNFSSSLSVAPPTQGTWRSNGYVSAVRLVDYILRERKANIQLHDHHKHARPRLFPSSLSHHHIPTSHSNISWLPT